MKSNNIPKHDLYKCIERYTQIGLYEPTPEQQRQNRMYACTLYRFIRDTVGVEYMCERFWSEAARLEVDVPLDMDDDSLSRCIGRVYETVDMDITAHSHDGQLPMYCTLEQMKQITRAWDLYHERCQYIEEHC